MDFSERPFLVIWETTKACDLACVHCRASADPYPGLNELTTAEAFRMIDSIAAMKTPILVFSGGDCLKRSDLPELIRHSKSKGLRTGAIPAVTPALTREKIHELRETGLDQIAFSLDAADPAEHDAFRRVSGVFARTMEAVQWSRQVGLAVQINSLVNIHNTENLTLLLDLIENLGIVFWEVFFLVPVGRGTELPLLSAEKFEAAFEKIYELSQRAPFIIKITEAPHYRRFCIEKEMLKEGKDPRKAKFGEIDMPHYLRKTHGPHGSIGMAPQGVNSGKGFVFVSYEGEVYPSGFLPISAGNIRKAPLPKIYRDAPLFRELRDSALLKGRCGICPFRDICGGSRSRAYAVTGDYLAEDPSCVFQPGGVSVHP